jgi:flagellar biosynthetic protein FlhB
MAEKSDEAEKTELPTAQRIKKSKEDGQRANFTSISILTGLLGSVMGVAISYFLVLEEVKFGFSDMLTVTKRHDWPNIELSHWFIDKAVWAFFLMLPFFLSVLITAIIVAYGTVGFSISIHKFRLELNRCNPLMGLQRLMSRDTWVNFFFSLIKCLSIALSVFFIMTTQYSTILSFEQNKIETALNQTMVWGFLSTVTLIGSFIFWTLIEMLYQKWSFLEKIKMSKREMKEETKQEEVRTEIKSKMKQIQYQRVKDGHKEDIKSATALITDGYLYAVVLRYAENKDAAPMVLTKGSGLRARKIKAIAYQHGIIEIINPPLARQLFTQSEKGQIIPIALYETVAKLLAYLTQLSSNKK